MMDSDRDQVQYKNCRRMMIYRVFQKTDVCFFHFGDNCGKYTVILTIFPELQQEVYEA